MMTVSHPMLLSEQLLDRSLAATLAAIEIYNKPDFRYREELFSILLINGWELLLKARLLRDADEALLAITATDAAGVPKKSRSGADLTIGLGTAIDRLALDDRVRENLVLLLEVRDAAVHLVADADVQYVVYALGAANLQNYQRLCNAWFGRNLSEYNFFILPLGFSHAFKTLAMIDTGSKCAPVAALLTAVLDATESLPSDSEDAFHLVCEVRVRLVSQKTQSQAVDSTVGITADPAHATAIIVKYKSPIDQYPLSYRELEAAVRSARSGSKQSDVQRVLKAHGMKGDPRYSGYNFRTQAHKRRYEAEGVLPKDPVVIYNHDAVRLIVADLAATD